MQQFLYSPDDAPARAHFRPTGRLTALSSTQFDQFASASEKDLSKLWEQMKDEQSPIPLGHDGYLKLWSLDRPRIQADYLQIEWSDDLASLRRNYSIAHSIVNKLGKRMEAKLKHYLRSVRLDSPGGDS